MRGAAAMHPTQNDDEASDTEWPDRPRISRPPKVANDAIIAATASL